jgi:uncharacterized protein (DUF433 family)
MAHALTTTEVAALTGLDEARVRKEIEHGLFGTESPPRFDEADMVYLRTLKLIELELGLKDRSKLLHVIHEKLSARRQPPATVNLGPALALKLGDIVRELRDLLRDFSDWKDQLVIDDAILGGEPVFPRSRLAVRHIGALVEKDGGFDEAREDHPKLTKRDLEYARLYTRAYPRRGRPPAQQ